MRIKFKWQWCDKIGYNNLEIYEYYLGIIFQNNIRFLEIWLNLGIGSLVFSYDKFGGNNE